MYLKIDFAPSKGLPEVSRSAGGVLMIIWEV